jgi:hypothetical protein
VKLLSLFLITVIVLSIFPIIGGGETVAVSENLNARNSFNFVHDFSLNIIFVGFREEVVDVGIMDSAIQKSYLYDYGNFSVDHIFNISYYFSDPLYYASLRAFVLDNSVNGTDTTSRLNITALQIQKSTDQKKSIFLDQSGRAIDAVEVENWFEANPYVTDYDSSYYFYVLNFTDFDSPDHSLEHWFNVTELDYEANSLRDFWRLEWDNSLNPDVKFPYACFTSDSRTFFIDPSAFQWYLTWARIWWGLSVSGPKYQYYCEDLDEFLKTRDLDTSQGRSELAYYLAGWVEDGLSNLLAPDLWVSSGISQAQSMSIQVKVLNNASESGYTNEFMSWIINKTFAEEALTELAPFIDIDVSVEFWNLSGYPVLQEIFEDAVINQVDGWTYYDGYQVWDGLYSVRGVYFDLDAGDIVINGFVFLEENMSMMVYGGEYTGLGGSGQILVMKEVGRYFKDDGVTPKSGLGLVFIHEAGHNLGFPHTFTHGETYAGDFAFDVMGYYPYSFHFTQVRKDCFRRLVVDFRVFNLSGLLEGDYLLYARKNSTPTIDAEFDIMNSRINETWQLYDEMKYLEAFNKIVEAETCELDLRNLIWIYLSDLNNDQKIDIFDVVTVAVAYGSESGDENWNPDADLVQNGVIDIYDIVVVAGNYAETW